MRGIAKCKLNFRTEPEKADNIIKVLDAGQAVNIKEELGDWLKVTAGRKSGYVMTQYIAIETSNEEQTAAEEHKEETPETIAMKKGDIDGEIDADGNFIIDGKVVGKIDGEDIVITDPEIIAETLAEMEKGADGNE